MRHGFTRLLNRKKNTSPDTSSLRLLIANATGSKYLPQTKIIRSLELKSVIKESLAITLSTDNGTKK